MDKILNAVLRLATPIYHDLFGIGIISNHVFVIMNVGAADALGAEITLYLEIVEDIWLTVSIFAYGASNKFVAS